MGIDIGAKLPEPTIVTGSDISDFGARKEKFDGERK